MAAALVCAVTAVALSVAPDSSQIHHQGDFTATCPSASWTVYRTTPFKPDAAPCDSWGEAKGTGCSLSPILSSDSGLYWCQNHNQSECSPTANITVSKAKVILESPLFPVTEGERVTLRCSFKNRRTDKPTSNFNAPFFRNGTLVGVFPGGEMTLSSVSPVDEGLYHCEHPTGARSAGSRLTVKKNDTALTLVPPTSLPHPMGVPLPRLVSFLVLVLLYTFILCISVSIYCKWSRAQDKQKQESERISLRRIRDV